MIDKRSESEKLVHNSIQRKPLQELHPSKYSSSYLFLDTLLLHECHMYGFVLLDIQCCYNKHFSDLQNNNNFHNIKSRFQSTIGKLCLFIFED